VQSCDADHFAESDMPLLVAYVQAVAQHERAVATLRRDGDVIVNARGSLAISPWITVQEKSSREMIGLALRLRLAPQARYERAKAPKTLDWMTREVLKKEAESYDE
jgi:phage terminase small subunit